MMGDTSNSEKYEPIPGTFILVPPRTKIILIVSLKSDAELDILISQPFSKQKYSLIPQFEELYSVYATLTSQSFMYF